MLPYNKHDWNDHLFEIQGSMVAEIILRVLACVVWSAAVVVVQMLISPYGYSLAVPAIGHTLTGFALGLLLVFRTNSSYDRFWEGRRMWGSIINESRNLARATRTYLAHEPDTVRTCLLWTVHFAWATMHRLRGRSGVGPDPRGVDEEAVAAALREEHVPLAVACRISEQFQQARDRGSISDYKQMTLDQNVQLLIDYLGACERIRSTPLPFAYVVHLRRALILYCFTLPFAMLDPLGWETVPAVLLIAYLLFGIEEIGVEIEDPFGDDYNDLPLARYCETIEANLRALLPAPHLEANRERSSAGAALTKADVLIDE